ncbi:MAG: hypothetical protein RLZ98_2039 [Pseudomonadota bacterium]
MVQIITEKDVESLADMPEIIGALVTAFKARANGDILNVPRQRADFWGARLNLMAAGSKDLERYAIKAYGNAGHHVLLYEKGKGLLALIEATMLGRIRTGAASGVATERLARADAHRLGMIGAGKQALTQALAISCARDLTEVNVYSRTREQLANFCSELERRLAIPVNPAPTPEAALRDADIVVAATTSRTPVVLSEWVKDGAHVNGIGANAANRRELDGNLLARASLIVVDEPEQARIEAGELIDLTAAGKLQWSDIVPIHQLVASPPASRDPAAVTVFKSLGMALEDLAAASLVYDRYMAQ